MVDAHRRFLAARLRKSIAVPITSLRMHYAGDDIPIIQRMLMILTRNSEPVYMRTHIHAY